MNMPEELPDVLVAAFKAEERIVAQIDTLLAHHDVHLHRYMLKPTNEALAQVLKVVIAHYQINLAVQSVKHFRPFGSTTQTEVTQVKHCIVHSHDTIPIRDYRLVHLLHVLERSVAELDDVRMIEMGVGSEERTLWVKIEVHCSDR